MDVERLVKSKQRVSDHGEVFTPRSIVENMLDLVEGESFRIDSRFLEPACGDGNFLRVILARKLKIVDLKYARNEFERRHYAMLGLMCIYGVELLEDNATRCREMLLDVFEGFIGSDDGHPWKAAASAVLELNIIQGDAMAMQKVDGAPLVFPEWGYLGRGRFYRRDFRFENLSQRSAWSAARYEGQGSLFANVDDTEVFRPEMDYGSFTIDRLAEMG